MHVDVQCSMVGPVRLRKQGVEAGSGQPGQRAVLAALLLRPGKPVSASKPAEHVPGGDAPPAAGGYVRAYVYRPRQALRERGNSSVSLIDGGYPRQSQRDALDLNRFTEVTARAWKARSADGLASVAGLLAQDLGSANAAPSGGRRNPPWGLGRSAGALD
jgi:DNA-binding SARP family transcriptional activator